MLYNCTIMVTVGIKGLRIYSLIRSLWPTVACEKVKTVAERAKS